MSFLSLVQTFTGNVFQPRTVEVRACTALA
jgi:hypothetical protein